jgi:murein DD-endopeptidase MepM/ murein hydrolase activator NlpD
MAKQVSSPLITAFNRIGNLGASAKMSNKLQSDFAGFLNFLEVQKAQLDAEELPPKRKIKALATLNVASTFGRPTSLLNSLASGALDVAGFLGNFFPSRQPKGVKPPKPVVKGPRLKLGGIKALGVVNTLFAGLDFATGLQEGESVGKAAAGAGGSLAGSLLGGAIGQALIPVPGLGFVLGSMAGGFLGGYAADRVVEAGEGIAGKQKQRLKEQEAKQKSLVSGGSSFGEVINKFSSAVEKFEAGVSQGLFGSMSEQGEAPMEDVSGEVKTEYIDEEPSVDQVSEIYTAEGGDSPASHFTSGFGWRWGKMHNGVDFAHPNQNSPVTVLQPGVVDSGYEGGYGNWVAVHHTDGAETFYGHLSKVNVKKGQRIEAGTVIGNQGDTGRSFGAHVHFEYRPGGPGTKPVDGRSVASKYFRYGGKVSVKPRKPNDVSQKLGDVSTNYPQQDSDKLQSQQQTNVEPTKNQAQQLTQQVKPNYQQQSNTQKNISQMVSPDSTQNNIPQKVNMIQYYPTYNQAQSSVTVIPIAVGSNNQQKPVVISGGGGGGGQGGAVIMSGPNSGELVNHLFKTMLLTNLSGS